MKVPVEVSVRLLLTSGGEHISVTGSGSTVTVEFPSIKSGLRHLRGFFERPELVERLERFDAILSSLDLSLYAKVRSLTFAILGVKVRKPVKLILSLITYLEMHHKAVSRMHRH
jgi:hypothetical protein